MMMDQHHLPRTLTLLCINHTTVLICQEA